MLDLKMEVYTPALELIGFLEIQRSVIWEDKAFTAGSFSLESIITSNTLTMLQPENIIWIEGETAGIIEYVQEKAGESGPYITVKGRTLTGILDRRVLWGLYSLKGTAPEIMNALVNDCCINPTRGDMEARKIPELVLMDAPAGGDTIQIQKTGGTLLEILETLGETYGVAFGVRFNPAVPQMEFWTRWGQDRSIYQSDNNPVLYSTELDDVLSSEYLYNSQNYRNVAHIAGEGEGNDRVYVTVENEVVDPDIPAPPTPPGPTPTTKYTVTLLVDPKGGGTVDGGGSYEQGQQVTLTQTTADGYRFVGWYNAAGEQLGAGTDYTFTPTENVTITAKYAAIPVYTITATVDPSGSGNVTGAGQYQEGATVNLKAAANDGYTFFDWKEGGSTVYNESAYSFTAEKNRDLVAAFAEKSSGRLPNKYKEVKYIQSDSNCGINTEIELDLYLDSFTIEIEADAYLSGYEYILDNSTGSSPRCTVRRTKSSNIQRYWGKSSVVNTTKNIENRKIVISLSNHVLTIDGTSAATTAASTVINGSFCLLHGGSSSSDTSYKSIQAKLYSCQINQGGKLVRNFVPCINPSGQVGLYDLVGGKFYGNVGTGAFNAGPAV